ncbi:MAG: phospholipase D family protein, partial [Pseudomonadota bacterium]
MLKKHLQIFIFGLLSLLTACATVPKDFEQIPSSAWPTPETTQLGRFFAKDAPSDNELSGVFLLDEPRTALQIRLGFASLAEKTLDLQYYIWKDDTTGGLLLHRVLQAADRGVQVRILIDDISHSGRDDLYATVDAHPNVQVRLFNPTGNRNLGRNLNFVLYKRKLDRRMHNKIFLADSAVTVLGGRNIGDDYFGIDSTLNFRDLDVLAVGPAAKEASEAYDSYWNSRVAVPIAVLRQETVLPEDLKRLRGELDNRLQVLDIPYPVPVSFEEVETSLIALRQALIWGQAKVIVDPIARLTDDSESAFVKMGRELNENIKQALVIQSPYMVPASYGVDFIASLIARGVHVRMLTNSLMSNDHLLVHAHYMKYRKPLINAGAELYELRSDAALLEFLQQEKNTASSVRAGLHTKALVADDHTTMIGSYNMDPRSLELNSEIAPGISRVPAPHPR